MQRAARLDSKSNSHLKFEGALERSPLSSFAYFRENWKSMCAFPGFPLFPVLHILDISFWTVQRSFKVPRGVKDCH